MTIKANQPTLHAACKALPWRDVRAVSTTNRGNGRRIRLHDQDRASHGMDQLPRRRTHHPTPPNPNHQGPQDNRSGLPDLLGDIIAAPPAAVATWITGTGESRTRCTGPRRHLRERHRLRTGNGPQIMAIVRNTTISLLRIAGHTRIATALRHHERSTSRPVDLLLNT